MAVSAEGYAGWRRFARENRLTMSAVADALGLVLGTEDGLPEPLRTEIIRVAGDIADERRSRRGTQ